MRSERGGMMTLWAASGQTSLALIGGCLACKPRAPAAHFFAQQEHFASVPGQIN